MFCALLVLGAAYLAGCADGYGKVCPFTRVKLQRNDLKLNLYLFYTKMLL